MQRESELIARLVPDSTWKRINRLLPEAGGADPRAAIALLVGLAAVVLAALLAT